MQEIRREVVSVVSPRHMIEIRLVEKRIPITEQWDSLFSFAFKIVILFLNVICDNYKHFVDSVNR